MNEIAIQCTSLTKKYRTRPSLSQILFEKKAYSQKNTYHYALRNVNLTLYRGEIVGVIGMNGSGKTTLSRIIAGITAPTSGRVLCNGEVNMLSATIGLNDYMSGKDNIRYKCMLLGMSRADTDRILPSIADYADIGNYIDLPLRTYSSGMRARLGFSIAVHILPDILIVDEALSVGDVGFAAKCSQTMAEMKEQRRTILFISHSVGQMQGFCDRIIWLNRGEIIAEDVPERLILPYCAFAREYNEMSNQERDSFQPDVAEYQRRYLPRNQLERV